MKKFLAILMSLMIVSTMVCGMVAYADEPVVTQESTEGEVTDMEQTLPELTEEDQASMKQTVAIEFTDADEIMLRVYVSGTDALLEYYQTMYMIYQQTAVDVVEYEGTKALLMNESAISEANLYAQGIGLIEKKGFFADVKKVFAVDTSVSGNYEEGMELITYKISMPGFISAENADVQKGAVVKTVIAGQNNNFMFTCTKLNWINCLIGLMILAVLVLVVLIIIFSKKKKNLPEKLADAVEEIAEKVEDKIEEVVEKVEPAKEKVEEIVEEVKETIEEKIEEIKEEVKEEKTEE